VKDNIKTYNKNVGCEDGNLLNSLGIWFSDKSLVSVDLNLRDL